MAIGNIFARQNIVGPSISNGSKEACVVVFPTVLLVFVNVCLPVIGNSSLENLDLLDYNGRK